MLIEIKHKKLKLFFNLLY